MSRTDRDLITFFQMTRPTHADMLTHHENKLNKSFFSSVCADTFSAFSENWKMVKLVFPTRFSALERRPYLNTVLNVLSFSLDNAFVFIKAQLDSAMLFDHAVDEP